MTNAANFYASNIAVFEHKGDLAMVAHLRECEALHLEIEARKATVCTVASPNDPHGNSCVADGGYRYAVKARAEAGQWFVSKPYVNVRSHAFKDSKPYTAAAVREASRGWTVVHGPSGLAAAYPDSLKEARAVLKRLSAIHLSDITDGKQLAKVKAAINDGDIIDHTIAA